MSFPPLPLAKWKTIYANAREADWLLLPSKYLVNVEELRNRRAVFFLLSETYPKFHFYPIIAPLNPLQDN